MEAQGSNVNSYVTKPNESSHPSCWDEEQATKDGKIKTLVFQHVVWMVFYGLKDGILNHLFDFSRRVPLMIKKNALTTVVPYLLICQRMLMNKGAGTT